MVLMMKPSVGLTVLTSSFIILFTIVVFPALSRPLDHVRMAIKLNRSDHWQGNKALAASEFSFLCLSDVLSVELIASLKAEKECGEDQLLSRHLFTKAGFLSDKTWGYDSDAFRG